MKLNTISTIALAALLTLAAASAQVPAILNYQGRVSIGGSNYNGTGLFKFALVNSNGTATFWNNAGALTTNEPANAVSLVVTQGLYSVLVGDTSLANMAAIPQSVFTNNDLRLRVWFSPATNGTFLPFSPDQQLGAAPYAMRAATADNASSSGGTNNTVSGLYATIGGGSGNTASGEESTVGGGSANTAAAEGATVAGGIQNLNNSYAATVGGGEANTAANDYATISGGFENTAAGVQATVGGGTANAANGIGATVGGGSGNTASDVATVGGGIANTASGQASTVGGGTNNTASGRDAVVSGGRDNTASLRSASVGGGEGNTAGGYGATIAGGAGNTATASFSAMGGGIANTASGQASTVGGGTNNTAGGYGATIAGGAGNTASGIYAVVGGADNTASSNFATIGGGRFNTASGSSATIGGGVENYNSGGSATIGGGSLNTNSGNFATIGGGFRHTASGDNATIPGGLLNAATNFAFAAGRRAKATNDGAFVWADSTDADFSSLGTDTFNVRASGGVFLRGDTNSGRLSIFPSVTDKSSQILLSENHTRTLGMILRYDGTTNNDPLHIIGLTSGVESAPILTISRTFARVGVNQPSPTATFQVVNATCDGSTWVNSSDRDLKTSFKSVDGAEILRKVAGLPISEWTYKTSTNGARHVGPTAQDFRAAFGLGNDDKTISTVDPSGVALAAIQGLVEEIKLRDTRIERLEAELGEIRKQLNNLPPAP